MALAPQNQRKHFRPIWDSIIDYMIAKPTASNEEIGNFVNRRPVSISMIINSDLFKARYAQRRQEFNLRHDGAIMDKTVKIAHASLDAIVGVLEKKKDSLPLASLQSISESALGRLGYGAKSVPEGGTVVNVNNGSTTVIHAPITRDQLLEAQMAYRQVQRMEQVGQIIDHQATPQLENSVVNSQEAEPVKGGEEEGELAPTPLTT